MSELPSREEIAEAAAVADQLRIYQHRGKTDCITYGNADSRVILTILRMARFALSGRLVDRETIDYEAMAKDIASNHYDETWEELKPDTRSGLVALAHEYVAAAIGDTG